MTYRKEACPRLLEYKPPRIALALLLTAGSLQLISSYLTPTLPASIPGGMATGLLGFGIMLRGWWLFRKNDTAICPTARTTTLITNDIYRLTRNPMYLGIVLMLLGVAIGTGGLFFYVSALTFFLIIDFAFCPFEEKKLVSEFGDAFARYQARTPRWL